MPDYRRHETSEVEIAELGRSTRGQSLCTKWRAEHVGRITASLSHRAMTALRPHVPDKLVREIMKYNEESKTKALRWDDPREHGLRLEPLARRAYMHVKNVSVEECGLSSDSVFQRKKAAPNMDMRPTSEHNTGPF